MKFQFIKEKLFKNINPLKLLEYFSISMASFSVVIVIALIVNSKTDLENGQGGFETSGIPMVTEDVLAKSESIETLNAETFLDTELTYFSYRVRKGDMIGIIADQFGVTQDTIISVNNIRSSRLLQIGTYLKIPSMPGILYTVKEDGENLSSVAEKYSVNLEKCSLVNNIDKTVALKAGTMIFVPDAELDWVTRQEINGDLFKKPIRARWYLSSSFGWRSSPFTGKRSYHSGVDMACPTGTYIYSAMPGTVTSTGFSEVYGNYVIVKHHSGYKTLYAHMSVILAVKGQRVTQDSRIGKVGSTGLSTGPHLHFTVFKNGKQVNPANLWG